MSKRVIKGVLDNFLGTYTSRYTDYNGYWLFGILVKDLSELKIDLLGSTEKGAESTPSGVAAEIARYKFREQMERTGLAVSYARAAEIDIQKTENLENGFVNGRVCSGYTIRFVARVTSQAGFTHEVERAIFVAPHDPKIENRSTRSPG